MGSDRHYPEEAPAHKVTVDGFWMDGCTVTNREFQRFVEAPGYVTLAERQANAADYPGAKPELLAPPPSYSRRPRVARACALHRAGRPENRGVRTDEAR